MSNRTNKKEKKRNQIPKAIVSNKLLLSPTIFPSKSQEDVQRLNKEKIHFSFHLLDIKHSSFNCGKTESEWFLHCFDNFYSISNLTFNEFERQRQHYDLHRHDFSKTKHHYAESVSAHVLEQISPENMIQFRLSTSGGRVHGIRYHNIFYVVWLDPHHNMNIDDRYGPQKLYDTPQRPYEILLEKVSILESEITSKNEVISRLTNDLDDAFEMLDEKHSS